MSEAREVVADYLISQVAGSEVPLPGSKPLPAISDEGVVLIPEADDWSAFHDQETGFPIIQGTEPKLIFGTGVIHSPDPGNIVAEAAVVDAAEIENVEGSTKSTVFATQTLEEAFLEGEIPQPGTLRDEGDVDAFGLEKSQQKLPSAMGLTALLELDEKSVIRFTLKGSVYNRFPVRFTSGHAGEWYRRTEYSTEVAVPWGALKSQPDTLIPVLFESELAKFITLKVRWRHVNMGGAASVASAFTVVAKHIGATEKSDIDIFHFNMTCAIEESGEFIPTPQLVNAEQASEEEQEIDFLFRHRASYARGHGTAARWSENSAGKVTKIYSESIPTFFQEVPETQIVGITLKMHDFATGERADVLATLRGVLEHYDSWISTSKISTSNLPVEQIPISRRLLERTDRIRNRIERGIALLEDESQVESFRAFQLMNEAMLLQQMNGRLALRVHESVSPLKFPAVKRSEGTGTVGEWYPFQIGFILMTLPGIVEPGDAYRDDVDLIFFPTGGGKTEAYLGMAAFTIILRRLRDVGHSGVDVLMRYTLRLLTVQQFERTSGLIAALEHMRRRNQAELGNAPISIGVWLGSGTTPNKRSDVVALYNSKAKGGGENKETNPFVLSRCPWCGAAFGYIKEARALVGYRLTTSGSKTLRFVCGDQTCEFSNENTALPIWITDEDVYAERPSYVIGTVDKFARMTWVEEARALFNIDKTGNRQGLPPELIIQDELHLISGPLGSMVGMYEGVIEELCSYKDQSGAVIRPKIIASTATTRNYARQIEGLYARKSVTLFPQAVNRAGESFFASVKRNEDGTPIKGTRFLGIFPSTYVTGQQATSQVAAILSQAPRAWVGEEKEIDYYTTGLWFFNSLKELGQTLTLMQSTVIALLRGMKAERRIPFGEKRFIDPLIELTGRISSDEISKLLDRLKIQSGEKDHVRTCLASSIMEVGVDVQRLGLLTIYSQPKLTAQYIQVAGRVGRDRSKGPGLVVALYNASRSRDRSVYENFLTFHERLYANVEPLSVTPFAIQTMEKGLLGAVLAHYRMTIPTSTSASKPNHELFAVSTGVLRERLIQTSPAPETLADFDARISNFIAQWERYEPSKWEYSWDQLNAKEGAQNQDTALMRGEKEPLATVEGDHSIFVPNSMRTVDGQTTLALEANPYSFQQEGGDF